MIVVSKKWKNIADANVKFKALVGETLRPWECNALWKKTISAEYSEYSNYMLDGEVDLIELLMERLPDDHLLINNVLVRPGLDADVIIVGPTGIWVLEVKTWIGRIQCQDGNWSRIKYVENQTICEQLPPADKQWEEEKFLVRDVLSHCFPDNKWSIGVRGGLVFAGKKTMFERTLIGNALCGNPDKWVDRIKYQYTDSYYENNKYRFLDAFLENHRSMITKPRDMRETEDATTAVDSLFVSA